MWGVTNAADIVQQKRHGMISSQKTLQFAASKCIGCGQCIVQCPKPVRQMVQDERNIFVKQSEKRIVKNARRVVCREVLDIALKTAQENGITKLDLIVLVIGVYSCIHEKELLFYFDMAKIGTITQDKLY